MEIAESNPNILPDIFLFEYDMMARSYITKKISAASANAAIFGVPKMFTPIWSLQSWKKWIEGEYGDHDRTRSAVREKKEFPYYQYFNPRNWTYYYDHSPLAKTLEKYIDYKKLNLASKPEQELKRSVIRLLITAVDVMTSKPLVFDNTQAEIGIRHILASSGYPIYGFPWIKVEDNVYAWDGSLLSNTPVEEEHSLCLLEMIKISLLSKTIQER